jgi:hypothetical protein
MPLSILLRRNEMIVFIYSSGTVGSRTNHHYKEGHCIFLQLEYPLHSFSSGCIPPGQYEYPFSIHLFAF